MNKIGVDTNIFIYTLDKSSPHYLKCDSFLKDTSNDLLTTNKVTKIATVNIDDFKNISEIELIDLDNYK